MSREFLIAVIDDDESFRRALVETLGSLGYGACGFHPLRNSSPGSGRVMRLRHTDIHMSGMSGLHLARLLTARRHGFRS